MIRIIWFSLFVNWNKSDRPPGCKYPGRDNIDSFSPL
jgi:hypothetical protein